MRGPLARWLVGASLLLAGVAAQASEPQIVDASADARVEIPLLPTAQQAARQLDLRAAYMTRAAASELPLATSSDGAREYLVVRLALSQVSAPTAVAVSSASDNNACLRCLWLVGWNATDARWAAFVKRETSATSDATGEYVYAMGPVNADWSSAGGPQPVGARTQIEGTFEEGIPGAFVLYVPLDAAPPAATLEATYMESWYGATGSSEWRVSDRGPDCLVESCPFGAPVVIEAAPLGGPPVTVPPAAGRSVSWPPLAGIAAALALGGGAALFAVLARRRARPRYQFVRDLARGSFGWTWLAEDTRLKRRVVVKELHAAAKADARTRAMLLREAQIVAQISHPNVVTIHDVELEGAAPRIIMEYVEGGSLGDRLTQGPLGLARAMQLADELLQALEVVHGAGVVHRDIKPANVLLTKAGRAKLVDFGIARSGEAAETLSATAGITGTPLYMAPEQVRGEPADARTDLYALAAVVHEAATGGRVVGAPASLLALERAILHEPPRLGVEEPVRALLARALAKDPAERYLSAAEMREAFTRAAPLVA